MLQSIAALLVRASRLAGSDVTALTSALSTLVYLPSWLLTAAKNARTGARYAPAARSQNNAMIWGSLSSRSAESSMIAETVPRCSYGM